MKIFDAVGLFLSVTILCGGIFFTFYLKGFFFLHPIKTVKEMFRKKEKSGISPLRAFSASLAGTLGVGNIVGVSVAMIIGGAGAVLWIWISALISMVLKYCEITLGVKYRLREGKSFRGGPMFYMKYGLRGRTGALLAYIFSAAGVISSFSLGNIVQISAASDSAFLIFGADKALFATAYALLTALVILGGFERISRVTGAILPIISAVYLTLCFACIFKDIALLPSVIDRIFSEAFVFDSAFGGILGFLLSRNVSQGVAKGTFSHESGSGTAPIAHANAQTDMPARQGLLGLFEVFADTIVICTMSAFVILTAQISGITCENGMELVLRSFESSLGPWTKYIIGISIIIFAFSTAICWAFYGKSCLAYITSSKKASVMYILLYLAFTVLGASLSQDLVWKTADAAVSLMTATNMPALFLMRNEIRRETQALMGKKRLTF